MAHRCPECDSLCCCLGDIDDIDFGDSHHDCVHYMRLECDGYDNEFDYENALYDEDDY